MSDADDSTPAVWDPTARGGAGGWVRRGATADVPEPARGPSGPPAEAAPGDSTDSGAADGGEQRPTALLPRVPGQAEEPEPTLVRPQQPSGYARPPYRRPTPGQPLGGGPEAAPVAAEPAAADRRRLSPLLVLAGVVVAALVGGFAVRALDGGTANHPSALASAPPVTAPSTAASTPSATATAGAASAAPGGPGASASGGPSGSPSGSPSTGAGAGGGNGQAEATAVDQLLEQSSSSLQQVTDAVAQVSQCQASGSVAAAQATLSQAAASRQALVTRLTALDVSQLQGGAQAVQVLARAWTESATADTDYARWAGAMAKGGCTPDNAPQNADYADAGTQSGLATDDRNTFIDLWTPIAMQYGLPTRTADAI